MPHILINIYAKRLVLKTEVVRHLETLVFAVVDRTAKFGSTPDGVRRRRRPIRFLPRAVDDASDPGPTAAASVAWKRGFRVDNWDFLSRLNKLSSAQKATSLISQDLWLHSKFEPGEFGSHNSLNSSFELRSPVADLISKVKDFSFL